MDPKGCDKVSLQDRRGRNDRKKFFRNRRTMKSKLYNLNKKRNGKNGKVNR